MNDRWFINRIGLINFWYYDEEEFHFCDGRLLLRGANGSGKSVTMQSFIPLLLDGNKSPERLDPFGSRARKLENYLLGEDDLGEDERTGYLYMELVKQKTGIYLTIGMGLRAKRGKSMDFWGFAITDGRRIGKNFFLYKDVGEKVPLSKTELKNRIGEGGEFHESQADYMGMVNKLLFGFENIEDYDELIKLLVHLRTPKLSKDFKPTVIYDIMNNSLQPLSDEDLRPMSEAIENMDNIKSQLEVLKESKKAADRLKNEYDKYNRFVLLEKAKNLLEARQQLDKTRQEVQQLEKAGEEYRRAYEQADSNLEQLRTTQKVLEHKKRELEQHDSFRAKQELDKREQLLQQLQQQEKEKQNNLEGKKKRQIQLQNNLNGIESEREQLQQDIMQLLEEMDSLADDFYFHEHAFARDEMCKDLSRQYNFSYLNNEIKRYREKISKGKKALEEEKRQTQEYDKALQELDHAKNERDNAVRELDKAGTLFEEAKEEFIEQVYQWNRSNTQLKLSEPSVIGVARLVRGYGQNTGYDDILSEVRKEYHFLESNVRAEKIKLESLKTGYEEELKSKQVELAEWKSKKDPEPARESKVVLNREKMIQQGIPFLPLYKAVDFQPGLSEELKGRLEEALMDMGLLDALIVPKKYQKQVLQVDEGMADRYIFPEPQYFRHELSSLLKPEQLIEGELTYEDIDNVLKSIMLDQQEALTYINEKGEYGIGVLKGKVSAATCARFIGSQARKSYREEIIRKIEIEIEEIKARICGQEEKIKELENKLEALQTEFKRFPDKKDLETAFGFVYAARLKLESTQKEVEAKERYAEKSYSLLKQIREHVREITFRMEIPLNVEAYEQAQEDADAYKDMLRDLETRHTKLLQLVRQIQTIQEQVEDILQDIDNLLYDLTRIGRDITENVKIIDNYRELLKQTNYEEIRKEIEECIEGLKTIPQRIEKEINNAAIYREKYGTTSERLNRLKEEVLIVEKIYDVHREGFKQEYHLGYVAKPELENDMDNVARKIYNELKGEEKEGRSREDYATALQEKYHETRQYMTEYNLITEYIFDELPQEEDERIRKIFNAQKRLELTAKIQGREVNFYTLIEFLEDSIEENERLFKESDRQLFEDILAHTISKKIRAKIYHAEQWVKKMNDLMESMNTSSGLSFSLMWKSRIAETEEQLDTKELVDILKSDANLLREEDFNKLSSHFRSKIAQAKKELEDTGTTQTFHAIMKDILDYRKWFEFRLFFRKTGENKKELTNNAFDKFSGGEKAMAMYVPLFSSVYARYEGARKDCPRIISLDEAFAGVDENNIRDMFRLLEELKLNFIINSQILWGDYDTVPSLSICELVRPNNADFVTVIRYRWNGKVRELVTN